MTLATIIATAVTLGCAAVLIGHLFAGPPEVMLADNFAEHEDEAVLEPHPGWREARDGDTPGQLEPQLDDGPTSRLYIPAAKPKPEFHPLCFEAYCDRRYSDICKTCTPRMGVRP